MSKIHFLIEKSKNDLSEDKNFFTANSISHTRQGWRNLVQHILNNELNMVQRYQLINEYQIEEKERIYKVRSLPLFRLPNQETIRSITIRVGSILRYSILKTHLMILPTFVQFPPSEIEDQSEGERKKLVTHKRVTSNRSETAFRSILLFYSVLSPNKTFHQRSLLNNDDPSILTSPKWRSSIDDQHQMPFRPHQPSSDDVHEIIIKSIHRKSNQDESLSSLIRQHHRNNLSRLSLHSIFYGFAPGTKSRQTIHQPRPSESENLPSSPNYRLPANKIELDFHQQEIIRRSGSLKKNI